jgi:hypothetical protein
MTTQEIANRLVELCRANNFEGAWDELFAPGWETHELAEWGGGVRHGREEATAASDEWKSDIAEMHEMTISDPIVADDSFACVMSMDITSKTRGRNKESEICVYKIKDGKIISESFF